MHKCKKQWSDNSIMDMNKFKKNFKISPLCKASVSVNSEGGAQPTHNGTILLFVFSF